MQKVVDQETLAERIEHYEKLMEKDDKEKPELLDDLADGRELEICTQAHAWGFEKGIHRGIYETLKSFQLDMIKTGSAEEDGQSPSP